MQDVLSRLKALHRPRLLIRTARIGAANYSRDRDLRRILGGDRSPRPTAAILRIMELEQEMNQHRLRGEAAYAITRHIDLLTALIAEAACLSGFGPTANRPRATDR
ncbi:DUF6477 family protein [Pseudophaeobacter profundi]|uniref:DUF6477 family protein n=1 Tax=Pseudophaeobacter profundi TaxID=3034152 RepID=UPI00242F5EA5|nr:DUF6477 family protein [Pseudophaeobacter profundi]